MRAPVVRRASARAPTTRSTSGFETSTPAIVLPATRRWRSRAMVSTSGSSGTAGNLAPADVSAKLLAFEADPVGGDATAPLRLFEGRSDASHREHATTRRHQFAGRAPSGTPMKHEDVLQIGGDVDRRAGGGLVGIAGGSEHRRDRGSPSGHREVGRNPFAARDGREHVTERAPKPRDWQYCLRLRIAEATIELHDTRT